MGDGEEVVVLDYWSSSYAMRVKIALIEKGIKYTCIDQDLVNKSSLLVQMNPVQKMVPVLIHNGKPVSESLIIVQYIDETWPNSLSFFPSEPYLRAQAQFWAHFIDNKISVGAKKLWKAKGKEQETIKGEFIEDLKVLEEQLKEGELFFGGDKFGYVDIALVGLTSWFYTLEIFGNFSIEAHCPKIISWAKRCQQRESVSMSLPHPHKVYGFALGLKHKLEEVIS